MMQTAKIADQTSFGVLESANQAGQSILEDVSAAAPSLGSRFQMRRGDAEAAARARVAGRVNAAAVSDEEVKAHLAERASLLKKKFETSLTPGEERRLTYVRWSLDRIEDARTGMHLDVLESHVADYENFLDEIRTLNERISKIGRNSSL
jgi:hypothetical protein